jgi:hypothetical protein
MGSLSEELSTSEFAVTFVRKRYFSLRSDAPVIGGGGITYSRSRAGVRMHLRTPGPERACFFLIP